MAARARPSRISIMLRHPRSVVARVARLEQLCSEAGVSLPAAALQFALRHPGSVDRIPGLIGAAQVEKTIGCLQEAVPDGCWHRLDG